MNSDNTVTTIASENIRDLWKVLDNTPGKGPSAASKIIFFILLSFLLVFFKFIESSTININAQRKALTARTTRTSNQQQPVTTRGRGGSTRSKVRNWNARDD